MKQYSKLVAANIFISLILFSSCKKEITVASNSDVKQTSSASSRRADPGFAVNDMVMYWNEKTAIVLGSPRIQPLRARLFAIIQIAVHDALNNIKPKYERYTFYEREQHAHPDAAVASATYWAIRGLNVQGSFPIDTWYNESMTSVPDGESKELGKTLGKRSAEAIIANRSDDGLAQASVNSVIPANGVNPGEYRSTLMYANGILIQVPFRNIPNWGTVMKPYVIQSNHQFRPGHPYAVNSESYTMVLMVMLDKYGCSSGT